MGLLVLGTPFDWEQAKPHADYVREHGIQQLIHIWRRFKDRKGDKLLWGDEIEYLVVSFDDEDKNARLSLRQTEILMGLQADAVQQMKEMPGREACIPIFHPEYGRYMLESTPGMPYGASLEDLLTVEGNMKYRRKLAHVRMKPHEVPILLTSFPRLGAPGVFTDPYYPPHGPVARSLFLPDEITNPHVRFPTLTANIRRRRGAKVAINMPVFFDDKTPKPFIDPTIPRNLTTYPEDSNAQDGAALEDHVYMDAMGFGMGCCCLQITFQACSVSEARKMYDAFVPIGPIMLALTGASPIFRGYLTDVDCRWNVIAGSVDDRTDEERGLKPLDKDRYVIPKSRYDSVDCYISDSPLNRPEYNDTDVPINQGVKDTLLEAGMDDKLANHFGHLFIRDPIVIFEETLHQDDATSTDHFENIQSTNWQTVRFKPPPPAAPIGWRVEFRSMEVQLTDFENAAFSVFIVLLTRAILSFGLNFYLPISKVDENMHRAHQRDSVHSQKFFFRKNIWTPNSAPLLAHLKSISRPPTPTRTGPPPLSNGSSSASSSATNGGSVLPDKKVEFVGPCCSDHLDESLRTTTPSEFGPVEDEYEEMTIQEIILGKKGTDFPGLMGVVVAYLDAVNVEPAMRKRFDGALDLIRQRADGSLVTMATWMRNFVRSHPAYAHDSVVSKEINYDLIKAVDEIERGDRLAPELLPSSYRPKQATDTEEEFENYCGSAMKTGIKK